MSKNSTHYQDNDKLRELLAQYQENTRSMSVPQRIRVEQELGKAFLLIAVNLLKRPNFIKYTEERKQDMISDAVFNMCRYAHRYNVLRPKAFSYFTKVAENAFKHSIKKQKTSDTRHTSLELVESGSTINSLEW